MELAGKTVLITGAARRVGRAIALRLARAGVNVAVHYNRSAADAESCAAACRALGVRAATFAAALDDPRAAANLPAAVAREFGGLEILINNASVFDRMSLDDFDIAAWERELRVNLTAPMILAHAARDLLRAAGGRIINLCDAAVDRPWPDYLAYMTSKGGLLTLTRALARAFAPEVNVVAIAPGVADWPPDYDAGTRDRLTRRIPLARAGTPADIAAAVHFVLAEGDYITGEMIRIDGGRHTA